MQTKSKRRSSKSKKGGASPEDEYDAYFQTRLELKSSGHNLTSVLINPRQSSLGGMFDSFTNEQSAPLESMLPPDDPNEGKETKLKPKTFLGMVNNTLSQFSSHATPSTHSVATAHSSSSHSATGVAVGSSSSSNVLLRITLSENDQLEAMSTRLRNLFQPYQNLHSHNYNYNQNTEEIASYDTDTTSYSMVDASGRMRRNSSGDENDLLIVTNRIKSQEALGHCYEVIPELFFNPEELDCSTDEQFHNIYGDFDVNILIELIKLKFVESNGSHSPTKSGRSNVNPLRLRQNKLSSYLDIIDLTLQRVLYLHSPVFFGTLHTIETLRQEVSDTLDGYVRCSREKLRISNENVTAVGLAIPKLLHKKKQLNNVTELLEVMKRIKSYRDKIVLLMQKGEYIQSLEQITEVKDLIKSLPDLIKIEGIRIMDIQLDAYSSQCCNNINRLFEMEYGGR